MGKKDVGPTRDLPEQLHTPSYPTRLPPLYKEFTSPYAVDCPVRLAGQGPAATPVVGTSRRAGYSFHPYGVCWHLVEGGGGVC